MTSPVDVRQDLQLLQDDLAQILQELQNDEPARCPTCLHPISKVYCTPLSDTEVRLQLKRNGQSQYAGPCHRVDIL